MVTVKSHTRKTKKGRVRVSAHSRARVKGGLSRFPKPKMCRECLYDSKLTDEDVDIISVEDCIAQDESYKSSQRR